MVINIILYICCFSALIMLNKKSALANCLNNWYNNHGIYQIVCKISFFVYQVLGHMVIIISLRLHTLTLSTLIVSVKIWTSHDTLREITPERKFKNMKIYSRHVFLAGVLRCWIQSQYCSNFLVFWCKIWTFNLSNYLKSREEYGELMMLLLLCSFATLQNKNNTW